MMKTVLKNIGQLVTWDEDKGQMVILENQDLEIALDRIFSVGASIKAKDAREVNCLNCVVTPAFIDPHTHPVFADMRRKEFELRVQGADYETIAAAGGGILNSVASLRKISEDELFDRSFPRVKRFLEYGTATIEAKSGYGLTKDDELKSLRVIRRLNEALSLDLIPTFLGAHEIPEEYRDQREKYIRLITDEMIPAVAEEKLAVYCDVFTEKTVFSRDETDKIFAAAQAHGLRLRIHADEFSAIGGTELAVSRHADSADHLMRVSEEGIRALKNSHTTAIVLPGTTFFLGKTEYAPARRMWDEGVRVALATDFNPGSSMTQNLSVILTLACVYMHLTPLEAIQAVTWHSACSLGLESDRGILAPGKRADIAVWNVRDYRDLAYWYGMNHLKMLFKNGVREEYA
ncbi:MAG: imidazolonepropionase [Candidatus Neomarinimicrobiota bacterium]|nr:MAG: imidazolonepropionase [Candidatus Neomarinimicrobiota bacterium]